MYSNGTSFGQVKSDDFLLTLLGIGSGEVVGIPTISLSPPPSKTPSPEDFPFVEDVTAEFEANYIEPNDTEPFETSRYAGGPAGENRNASDNQTDILDSARSCKNPKTAMPLWEALLPKICVNHGGARRARQNKPSSR